ncbi:MAG: hypothetical protein HMLKMBBP_03872 [Planctomycetes bacterium]|nr:hypothetical protein [Planctomycetota bacterium]
MGIRSDVSVIVATRNRRDLLGDLLTSLAGCDPLPAEVVVVDDASTDAPDQAALSAARPFRVRLVRNDRCVGPGAARNRGVHASRGDLLVFTDDDCVVRPDWVGALAGALDRRADEMLGGLGGRVIARDRDLFSRYFEFHRILEPRPHDAEHPRRIPYLVTANCAIRRPGRSGMPCAREPSRGIPGDTLMSQSNVEAVVGRLATDEGFRRRFQHDRRAVLDELIAQGVRLNPVEVKALLNLDLAACERFAERLDPRIQKTGLRPDP